ncbi:hypothetical protein FOA52_001463 [Chlamydomonas sp. UWO 241]|nr:hypothetical protein FOA52_001463 [Chlamydomonas sp. UWO 241]
MLLPVPPDEHELRKLAEAHGGPRLLHFITNGKAARECMTSSGVVRVATTGVDIYHEIYSISFGSEPPTPSGTSAADAATMRDNPPPAASTSAAAGSGGVDGGVDGGRGVDGRRGVDGGVDGRRGVNGVDGGRGVDGVERVVMIMGFAAAHDCWLAAIHQLAEAAPIVERCVLGFRKCTRFLASEVKGFDSPKGGYDWL